MPEERAGKMVEILLVEDNPGDVRLTKEALKISKVHNKLAVVTDGQMAIDYLRKKGEFADVRRPDLVFLDLNLPKKSGVEVLAEIKNDPELKLIPIIVLTTSKAEEDIFRTYDLGVNSYVIKPVTFPALVETIKILGNYWLKIVELPPET